MTRAERSPAQRRREQARLATERAEIKRARALLEDLERLGIRLMPSADLVELVRRHLRAERARGRKEARRAAGCVPRVSRVLDLRRQLTLPALAGDP